MVWWNLVGACQEYGFKREGGGGHFEGGASQQNIKCKGGVT